MLLSSTLTLGDVNHVMAGNIAFLIFAVFSCVI